MQQGCKLHISLTLFSHVIHIYFSGLILTHVHFIIVMQCTKTLALQDSKSCKINCVGMNSCNNCNPGKPFTQTVWEHRTPPGMGIIKIKSYMKKFSHMGWAVYRPRFQKTTEISV